MNISVARSSVACALALLAAGLSSPAEAAAPPGPYLGVGAGVYNLDVNETDFDDNAAMWRAFGGARLSPYWAVELDYQRLAEVQEDVLGTDVELDADAWTVSVRPIIPLGEVIDLYGRAGWTWYDVEASIPTVGIEAPLGDGNEFTWGGGVDFHLGNNLTLRGDFSRIEIDDTDLNIISAAVMLRF